MKAIDKMKEFKTFCDFYKVKLSPDGFGSDYEIATAIIKGNDTTTVYRRICVQALNLDGIVKRTEETESGYTQRHSVQYNDVLIGRVEILELQNL